MYVNKTVVQITTLIFFITSIGAISYYNSVAGIVYASIFLLYLVNILKRDIDKQVQEVYYSLNSYIALSHQRKEDLGFEFREQMRKEGIEVEEETPEEPKTIADMLK